MVQTDWCELSPEMRSWICDGARGHGTEHTTWVAGVDNLGAQMNRVPVSGEENYSGAPIITSTGVLRTDDRAERIASMRISLRDELTTRRATMIAYLRLKLDENDMHGVQDAASDIREIDAKLSVLNA